MYEYIKGQIIEITPTNAVIDCGGLGFNILISLQTYDKLKSDSEGKLFIYHHLREDDEQLYGFATKDERELFKLLISVNGVGVGSARMMLSSLSDEELRNAIIGEDVHKIKSVKEVKFEGNPDLIQIVGEDIDSKYIAEIKKLSLSPDVIAKHHDLKIVYTPIHGTGLMPVTRILKELGYENLHVVKEQEKPDGNFPTAPYPNPEDPKVFKLALEMAEKINPDIIFGTDPDADRIGAIVKDSKGEYQILSGNQMGVLLTHYILSSYKELNMLPDNGAVIKTIVTTEMVRNICRDYNVELFDVLTGFKYIGEMMTGFENTNSHKFLFGFEESYGCLFGDHARDKDAVIAAQMIAEMTLYYKSQGLSLYEAFMKLSEKYGYSYGIEYRPIIKGINDSKEIMKRLFKMAKKYQTTIAYSGLQVEKELEEYMRKNNLPFEPYDGYDFGMKKNIGSNVVELLKKYSVEYDVPIFKKTSCAISFSQHIGRDYNSHYYRPNEMGCSQCPNKHNCHDFKGNIDKMKGIDYDLISKLPFDLKLVYKENHQCKLHREGLCKFPSQDCLNIKGTLLQTDRKLTTSDVRVIKWITGMTVDAIFEESPYISSDWLI